MKSNARNSRNQGKSKTEAPKQASYDLKSVLAANREFRAGLVTLLEQLSDGTLTSPLLELVHCSAKLEFSVTNYCQGGPAHG